MTTLKVIGIFAFAAALLGALVVMAGGVSGVVKIALAIVVVPFVVLLLTPRFWLGFFAGDVWRLLFRGRGRR